jgi:two-component system sensor histidine kinase KdpD
MKQRAPGTGAVVGIEILAAVALATGGVAALQSITPAAGLGILYLLAVLAIAIRRGQLAALLTAALGVLTLNYFFIAPRHRFEIAHSRDLVELIVLLIAAIVVGRLASFGRQRAAEAERRAEIAKAREHEAKLLAEVASAILPGKSVDQQLRAIGGSVAGAIGARHARLALEPVPRPAEDELSIPLHSSSRPGWLYVSRDSTTSREDIERIAMPLGRLIDVAIERERVAEQAAETEAGRRADVAKTAVLHAISHDLRSPLTAIVTAGAALRAAAVTDVERDELVDVIELESARLAKLVDDLLDLSRIESGAVAPQADWCDLRDVVASAVGQVHGDDRIRIELPSDMALVRADSAQLERVFTNLIDNALKFSPPESPVTISGGSRAGRVTIRVSDRGPGIPRRERPSVFQPFYRGKGDRRTGSGLGLAICRGFVEANGGQIVLQSGVDGGTSFAVSFPVVSPRGERGEAPAGSGSGIRALAGPDPGGSRT